MPPVTPGAGGLLGDEDITASRTPQNQAWPSFPEIGAGACSGGAVEQLVVLVGPVVALREIYRAVARGVAAHEVAEEDLQLLPASPGVSE